MATEKTITQDDIDAFDRMLRASYQRLSRFRAVVTVNTGVVGDASRVIVHGYLCGREFPSWRQVPEGEKEEKADICADGLVCKENGLVLGVLASAGISSHVGAVDIDVTYATLAAVAQALIDQDADPIRNEVCIACPDQWHETLCSDKKVDEVDDGTIRFRTSKTEFKWETEFLPSHSANGSFDPAQGIGYAFTKESMGLSYNSEPSGDIEWDSLNKRWQLSGIMSASAAVRLPKGIVKILGPKA